MGMESDSNAGLVTRLRGSTADIAAFRERGPLRPPLPARWRSPQAQRHSAPTCSSFRSVSECPQGIPLWVTVAAPTALLTKQLSESPGRRRYRADDATCGGQGRKGPWSLLPEVALLAKLPLRSELGDFAWPLVSGGESVLDAWKEVGHADVHEVLVEGGAHARTNRRESADRTDVPAGRSHEQGERSECRPFRGRPRDLAIPLRFPSPCRA